MVARLDLLGLRRLVARPDLLGPRRLAAFLGWLVFPSWLVFPGWLALRRLVLLLRLRVTLRRPVRHPGPIPAWRSWWLLVIRPRPFLLGPCPGWAGLRKSASTAGRCASYPGL